MSYKHVLVHVDAGARAGERLRIAASLAQRSEGRLTGLFAESDTLGRSLVGRRSPQQFGKALRSAAAAFQSAASEHGLDAEWWPLPPGELDLGGVAAHYCRYADLVVLGQHEGERAHVPEDFAAQVLLQSGRPVLLVPSSGRFGEVGRRVLVSWNASREATRALHDALPLLRGADAVLVLAFQAPSRGPAPARTESGPNIVRHLAAHGISAEYEPAYVKGSTVEASGVDVLSTMLNASAEFRADLVVMGGRGRSGLPFPRAARSTRRSLASMTAPVLLSN
jgi:nucleotide-binding universal stress UspA family protein